MQSWSQFKRTSTGLLPSSGLLGLTLGGLKAKFCHVGANLGILPAIMASIWAVLRPYSALLADAGANLVQLGRT